MHNLIYLQKLIFKQKPLDEKVFKNNRKMNCKFSSKLCSWYSLKAVDSENEMLVLSSLYLKDIDGEFLISLMKSAGNQTESGPLLGDLSQSDVVLDRALGDLLLYNATIQAQLRCEISSLTSSFSNLFWLAKKKRKN